MTCKIIIDSCLFACFCLSFFVVSFWRVGNFQQRGKNDSRKERKKGMYKTNENNFELFTFIVEFFLSLCAPFCLRFRYFFIRCDCWANFSPTFAHKKRSLLDIFLFPSSPTPSPSSPVPFCALLGFYFYYYCYDYFLATRNALMGKLRSRGTGSRHTGRWTKCADCGREHYISWPCDERLSALKWAN